MASGVSLEQDGVVWCPACGIPHEVGATHCSFCSRPLTEGWEAGGVDESAAAKSDSQTGALARTLADRVATQRSPGQRHGGPWKLSRRPQALTEEEIEARAAAIVAQARREEADEAFASTSLDGLGALADAEPIAQFDFLPPLRQRDREWLIAGLICCGLLILFAIGFVRFLGG